MKKIINTTIILFICLLLMTACGKTNSAILKSIEEQDYLVYDYNTKIVYYYFDKINGYSYMNEYYSENGKICRYIDGKIVEINDEV